ncbi:hypothetical protein BZK42_22145 [Citrobacter braakii]|uniref:Uncharacterized protein n=1 Tax=Citrobacter braakii TaxID=57706 RepID=A0A1V8NU51_CITBR|nr:hypothetical protein [Salmonella enterica subsp. enterica serovar Coeln]OQM39955.1 hypothetical protein BZK42_22145 [Citrobacter braakii]
MPCAPAMYTSLRFNREKMRITGQNARREKMCPSAIISLSCLLATKKKKSCLYNYKRMPDDRQLLWVSINNCSQFMQPVKVNKKQRVRWKWCDARFRNMENRRFIPAGATETVMRQAA